MHKVYSTIMTLCLVVLLAGPAMAQRGQRGQGQRGQGRGGQQNPVATLLQNESVQKELQLDEGQIAKVKEAVKTVQSKYQDASAKLRDLPQEERREKGRELSKTVANDTLQSVSSILKPDQTKRLKQIQLQRSGSRAFNEPDVQQTLKLTAEQKESIKTIQDDATKAMQALAPAGRGQGGNRGARPQGTTDPRATLRKETMEKLLSVLNYDQKKMWHEMTGEPFQIVRAPRQRGQEN
jgi:hypothetical protein